MKTQRGTSLLEMMIALFVLAVGLLGVASMQIKALQFNHTAYYYAQAVYLTSDILESIRANPQMRNGYALQFDDEPTAPVDCAAVDECTPAQMRDWNLSQFHERIEDVFVGGRAQIATAGNYVTVTLEFDDSRSNMPGQGDEIASYTITTEI